MNRMMLACCGLLVWATLSGCGGGSGTPRGYGGAPPESFNRRLEQRAQIYRSILQRQDPTLDRFFNGSAGYVVFPEVGKIGAGLAAGGGKGVLFEQGQPTGYVELFHASLGLQLGGQTYTQVIFFRTPNDVMRLKTNNFEFDATANAVGVTRGVGATVDYTNGVAVFILAREGLMFDASVGGQKFSYWPKQ
jgi:lipid-binding SYLF domain-containing protein